jgi:hypothetical protein
MSSALSMDRGTARLDELQVEVARMAIKACGAAERTAVTSIDAALQLVKDAPLDCGESMQAIANEILSRAQIMSTEIDRYLSLARDQRT